MRWADLIYEAWKRGRYVFILGNGGSGTTASHMCEDLGKSTLPESLLCDEHRKRLKVLSLTDNVGWIMAVPDVWRARFIIDQIAAWEKEGRMPQLIIICLPDDHTSGTREGSPTPEACVADNDLAFGRIIYDYSVNRTGLQMYLEFLIEEDQLESDKIPADINAFLDGFINTTFVESP